MPTVCVPNRSGSCPSPSACSLLAQGEFWRICAWPVWSPVISTQRDGAQTVCPE